MRTVCTAIFQIGERITVDRFLLFGCSKSSSFLFSLNPFNAFLYNLEYASIIHGTSEEFMKCISVDNTWLIDQLPRFHVRQLVCARVYRVHVST